MTKKQRAAHPALAASRSAPNPNAMPRPRFAGPPTKALPQTRLTGLAANIKKCEQGLARLAVHHKPPAGASIKVRTTHHLPAHKMYDPELGMWTFPFKSVARFTAAPTGSVTAPASFDLSSVIGGGSLLTGSGPLPITSSQLLIAFTPSNGNFSPLQLCKDGSENSLDVTTGWATPSLWDTMEFLPNMSSITEQHRVVNASLKVTYTGTSLSNCGVVYVYQGPHIPQFHKVNGTSIKLSVTQMVQRIKTNPRTVPYDVDNFRNGKIFHVGRGTQRRVFRSPYEASFPDSAYGNKLFKIPDSTTGTDLSSGEAPAGHAETTSDPTWTGPAGNQANIDSAGYYVHTHTVQAGGTSVTAYGEPVAGVPPTMQALYLFAEGLSLTGSNFLVEGVQQAEIQIDPDATTHVGFATPPNNHTPEPDAGDATYHLGGSK